jgi:hypothetical protein
MVAYRVAKRSQKRYNANFILGTLLVVDGGRGKWSMERFRFRSVDQHGDRHTLT